MNVHMTIYICNNCKQLLKEVYIVSNRTMKKSLLDNSLGYNLTIVEENILHRECPLCHSHSVTEVQVNKKNLKLVTELFKQNDIKNVWETIFDRLL